MANHGVPDRSRKTIQHARQLRKEASPPERILWNRLRGGRTFKVQFRRQHPLGPYIADFYCASAALVIEIDGKHHELTADHDEARDAWMCDHGLRVMRISATDVNTRIDDVLNWIAQEIGAT